MSSRDDAPRSALPIDRQVPHNRDAEEAILGSLLIDPDAYFNVIDVLSARDFYIERNSWVYEAIAALYDRREAVDFVTLCDELEKAGRLEELGGAAYITQTINVVPTSIHVEHYARIVKRAAVRRRLIAAAGEIASLGYREDEPLEEIVDRAEQAVFAISQQHLTAGVVPIQDGLSQFYDRVDELHRKGDGFVGLPTGFVHLDHLLGGLQRSDLIVVAGRPAMGKTSLVLNIAQNVAAMGQRVLLFSLEMSNEQLIQRLVAAEMGVGSERLRVGNLDTDEWPKFGEAVALIGEHDLLIDDTPGLTAMQLRARCRRFHAHKELDLVIVDYLQLMQGESRSENRTQEISYISRMLKNLARELNVPVLAASQLSRAVEQRHDKRPLLSDLRGSGSVEQDSDVVMFIYRDEVYNPDTPLKNIAEIITSKHRHGPTGTVELFFERALTRFRDLRPARA